MNAIPDCTAADPVFVVEVQRLEQGSIIRINGEPASRAFRTSVEMHAELNRLVAVLSEARLTALVALEEYRFKVGESRVVTCCR
jgi:hypothetical protein